MRRATPSSPRSARRPRTTSSASAINVFRVNVRVDRLRRGRSRIDRGHRRDGTNVLRRVLRSERDPPAAGVQRLHGPADRCGAGSGVHGRARRRELDDLRRQRRVDRHLLARERRDRDRDPRDGAHRVRARRRVPVLRGRQRDRSRPLQRRRAGRAERDRELQPRDAQVALGGCAGDRRPDHAQPDVLAGRRPAEPGRDGHARRVRGRLLLPLRRRSGRSTTARCATSASRSARSAGR